MVLLGLCTGLPLLWLVLKIVARPSLMAHPNARSSHHLPTPTMGGAAMVCVVLAYFLVLAQTEPALGWGLFASTAALAAMGLWDDITEIHPLPRLAAHLAASAAVVYLLAPPLPGWVLLVVWLGLVWLINLYNFMDGIDGLAAAQCLCFCAAAQALAGGVPGWAGDLLWLLSGVTLAFLTFNWPPAKIFMGDVGSGFLGLVLGALALHMAWSGVLPLVASMILLAGFLFDATYTLCVRMVTGQEFAQAHRSHLYQRLARRKGHLWTTCVFVSFTVLWLAPLAWLVTRYPAAQFYLLAAAAVPLALACWWSGAGREERTV
jgi:Fuc2NAc and GlcNAc transferase